MTALETRGGLLVGAMAEGEVIRRRRFEALFEENFRPLLGYAMRRIDDTSAAADVVAETFTTAWRRLDDVPNGTEARLWLYGTARRVLANYRRGERRRGALVDMLAEKMGIEKPHKHVAAGLGKRAIKAEIRDLKVKRQAALEAGDSDALKKSRRMIHRRKRKLRRLLQVS